MIFLKNDLFLIKDFSILRIVGDKSNLGCFDNNPYITLKSYVSTRRIIWQNEELHEKLLVEAAKKLWAKEKELLLEEKEQLLVVNQP